MNTVFSRLVLALVLIAFSALTAAAIHSAGGVVPMVREHLTGVVQWQIFVDLVVAIGLFVAWLWHDAKRLGRHFWFWAVFSITCGSFGPLLYLLTRPSGKAPE